MRVDDLYFDAASKDTDIKDHMRILVRYAKQCKHITEFGVRHGISTTAFLCVRPNVLISYDIEPCQIDEHKAAAEEAGITFTFKLEDTTKAVIENTDMIFFDTLHTYNQLSTELALHAHKASKFLMFHDTMTYGIIGEDGQPGILAAITEYVIAHPEWHLVHRNNNCNGLMVFGI